jgi:hypothetical protein
VAVTTSPVVRSFPARILRSTSERSHGRPWPVNGQRMGSKPVSGAIRIRRNPRRYARIWLRRAKRGALAEWLRSGLQSRLHRFDSGRRLRESPAPAGSFLEPTGRSSAARRRWARLSNTPAWGCTERGQRCSPPSPSPSPRFHPATTTPRRARTPTVRRRSRPRRAPSVVSHSIGRCCWSARSSSPSSCSRPAGGSRRWRSGS